MKPLGDPRAHYWRVLGMSKATGVDLAGAFASGRLESATWAGMVERCRACPWVKGCDRWLGAGQQAAVPPKRCLNRDRFGLLRVEQELEACE